MENQKGFKISQYACAVLLIVSSIALVAYQVVDIDDVATGLLYYVAQSFLLAGSIFGLDQYLRIIKKPEAVNRKVGGVSNSQHLVGQAADIRPKDPVQFQRLVDFLKAHALTDQLLTGSTWLHISWNPFALPRHYIHIGYYK